MNIDIMNYSTWAMGIIGAVALVTSIIVEFTKDLGFIKKIPTKFWTMIIAVVIAIAGGVTYDVVVNSTLHIPTIPLCIVGGVIASYVATYGWDTFKQLYDRFIGKENK